MCRVIPNSVLEVDSSTDLPIKKQSVSTEKPENVNSKADY